MDWRYGNLQGTKGKTGRHRWRIYRTCNYIPHSTPFTSTPRTSCVLWWASLLKQPCTDRPICYVLRILDSGSWARSSSDPLMSPTIHHTFLHLHFSCWKVLDSNLNSSVCSRSPFELRPWMDAFVAHLAEHRPVHVPPPPPYLHHTRSKTQPIHRRRPKGDERVLFGSVGSALLRKTASHERDDVCKWWTHLASNVCDVTSSLYTSPLAP